MKRLKSMLATLALLLCSLSASAHAFEVDGIYYDVTSSTDLTVAVTYQGSSYDSYSNEYFGSVVIPETVTYESKTYAVTSIGNLTFYDCSSLTSVTIPNGVTSIGDGAFSGCSSLTSVNIPNSVTSIGSFAFNRCSLTSVTIPNSVTSIGDGAFSGCSSLTSVTIPNGVTSIGSSAFSGCSSLTSVTIPNSVTSIRSSAFRDCSRLTSVTIPDGVTSIGNYTFYACSSLTSVTIPNSVTSIGEYAFRDCNNLTSVTIPDGVTSIGECTFSYCYSLTSVTIPNSVTSIGSSAFSNCRSLASVTIPNSVTSIGSSAFYYCSRLTSVHISDIAAWCNIEFGSYASNPLYYANHLYMNGKEITELKIPDGVTNIGEYTFDGCNNLTSVTIPDGVTSIGEYAFRDCSSLTSVKVLAETPPVSYDNTFSNYEIELCVPEKSVEAYQKTNPWSKFKTFKNLTGDDFEVKVCATPTIAYVNGKISFASETEGVEFVSSITDSDIKNYSTADIELTVTYNISVYATKEGYKDSEVAKATLCWIDVEPKSEGLTNTDIANVKALPVVVQASNGTITVSGANDGTMVEVYGISGTKLGEAKTAFNTATIHTDAQTGSVVIVKVGNKAIKIKI